VDGVCKLPATGRTPSDWSVVTDQSGTLPTGPTTGRTFRAASRPDVAASSPIAPVLTDIELVRLAKADRQAFGLLYDRYVDRVYRYCYRRLRTREAAEDATSQTFVRAMTAIDSHRDGTSFPAWLFTIAERIVIDIWRRQRPQASIDDVPESIDRDPTPEEAALDAEGRDAVHALLRHLPDDQRRAIELRLADLTGPEVAQVMGRPPGAVKMLQFRAITTLRRLLGASLDERGDHR